MATSPLAALRRALLPAFILVALGGAALLRLAHPDADLWFSNPSYANDLSLNFEEKASALAARNWILFGDVDSYGGIYQPQAFMPLGFLIHAAWYAAAGVSLAATRVPFAILAALTLAAMAWMARRQMSAPGLAAFVVLAGWNATLIAWQRSSLDDNLMLTGLVAMALWAPTPFARPPAFALWGLAATIAATAKPTGLVYAAAPVAALAWDLVRERRGRALRPLAALATGLALAAGVAAVLYAALGYFRPNPFYAWAEEYNRARGFVPPLAGVGRYLEALALHLPIPSGTERPLLALALAAPFLSKRTTFFTRAAWWGLVLALAAGAPLYLYYKRLVPLVPLFLYLAVAGLEGLVQRARAGLGRWRSASPGPAPALELVRRAATVACTIAAVAAAWLVLRTAAAGARETIAGNPRQTVPPGYHAMAIRVAAAIPATALIAAPDSFRVVAFDTRLPYRFTHDMVAGHLEHLSVEEAVERDARTVRARWRLLPLYDPEHPGRIDFRIVGPETAAHAPAAGEVSGMKSRQGEDAEAPVFVLDRGGPLP